jgi:hypothetical protein
MYAQVHSQSTLEQYFLTVASLGPVILSLVFEGANVGVDSHDRFTRALHGQEVDVDWIWSIECEERFTVHRAE